MNKITISLLVNAVGLVVSAAEAAPLTPSMLRVDGLLRVQLICDQYGNCREQHRDRPAVIIQEPRRQHHEERPHDRPVVIEQDPGPRREYYVDRPQPHGQPGIGIQVPGVSLGVGGGDHDRR